MELSLAPLPIDPPEELDISSALSILPSNEEPFIWLICAPPGSGASAVYQTLNKTFVYRRKVHALGANLHETRLRFQREREASPEQASEERFG